MTLQVHLHDVERLDVHEFHHKGEDCASARFIAKDKAQVTIYTTPRIALALAEAFDDAKAADEAAAERAWDDAHDPEVVAGRAAHTERLLKEAGR